MKTLKISVTIKWAKRVAAVGLCLSCLSAPAAPREPLPAPDGQRFLFVIDVSSGMEKLRTENETAVYELILSGVYGQMQPGDTYGLWTFNDETHAGKFPMQVWDTRRVNQIATIAAAFLNEQTYEKGSDARLMIENLTRIVRAVSNLNVFIISDGRSAIRGTPFDKAINADYKAQRRERIAAKRPFVTTLIAREGRIGNYSVTIAGQPILLPERPAPILISRKAAPPSQTGGALLSNTVIEATATAATSAPPAPKPPVAVRPAPAPSPASQDNTGANPPPPPVVEPVSSAPATSAAVISPLVSPAAVSAPASKPPVVQFITQSNSVTVALGTSAPEVRGAKTAPPMSSSTNTANTVVAESSEAVAVPEPRPAPPASNSEVLSAVESALSAVLPDPIVVAARELQFDPIKPGAPAAVPAVGLAGQPGFSGGLLLAFGTLLLATALFLLFVVFRRLRPPASGGSLITQSMERR